MSELWALWLAFKTGVVMGMAMVVVIAFLVALAMTRGQR